MSDNHGIYNDQFGSYEYSQIQPDFIRALDHEPKRTVPSPIPSSIQSYWRSFMKVIQAEIEMDREIGKKPRTQRNLENSAIILDYIQHVYMHSNLPETYRKELDSVIRSQKDLFQAPLKKRIFYPYGGEIPMKGLTDAQQMEFLNGFQPFKVEPREGEGKSKKKTRQNEEVGLRNRKNKKRQENDEDVVEQMQHMGLEDSEGMLDTFIEHGLQLMEVCRKWEFDPEAIKNVLHALMTVATDEDEEEIYIARDWLLEMIPAIQEERIKDHHKKLTKQETRLFNQFMQDLNTI